jgi:HAD superfamily hydrolase (TIGR01509 family)
MARAVLVSRGLCKRDESWTLDGSALDALMSLKADRYRRHLTGGDALYPPASACVRCLSPRFALAIASGSLRHEIQTILSGAGLLDAFPVIVGADDVTAGKPAPEPYLKAAELLGIDPAAAVAIEDSRWGLESARAAGMRTIGITTTYPASALIPADLVVDSLEAISPDVIDRL